MSTAALRDHLALNAGFHGAPAMLCVSGASGVGKTTVLAAIRAHVDARLLPILAFDSLGVPSIAEMERGWDSARGWQKAMTWLWVQIARSAHRTRPLVVLEGSFDPQYAIAACHANRMRYGVALLDLADDARRARLAQRGQRDHAITEPDDWASYLREQARDLGGTIVDASAPVDQLAARLSALALALVTAST